MLAISSTTNTIIVNGRPSSVLANTYIATESDNVAYFQYGECTGSITLAAAPKYNYYMQRIGNIPRDVIPVTEDACDVPDIVAYTQALAGAGETLDYAFLNNGNIEAVVNASNYLTGNLNDPLVPTPNGSGRRRRLLDNLNPATYGAPVVPMALGRCTTWYPDANDVVRVQYGVLSLKICQEQCYPPGCTVVGNGGHAYCYYLINDVSYNGLVLTAGSILFCKPGQYYLQIIQTGGTTTNGANADAADAALA